jgi:hypothetical protein
LDRDEILSRLASDGVLTASQVTEVKTMSQPTDNLSIIVGYVKGLGVPASRIANSLDLDTTAVMAMKERDRPIDWFTSGSGGGGLDQEMAERAERRDLAFLREEELEAIADDLSYEINLLAEEGYITGDQRSMYLNRLMGFGMGFGDTPSAADTLRNRMEIIDDLIAAGVPEGRFNGIIEFAGATVAAKAVRSEGTLAEASDADRAMLTTAARSGATPSAVAEPREGAEGIEGLGEKPDPLGGVNRFLAMMGNMGLVRNPDTGEMSFLPTPTRLTSAIPGTPDENVYFDPTTGMNFTKEMLATFDEDDVARYRNMAPTPDAQTIAQMAGGYYGAPTHFGAAPRITDAWMARYGVKPPRGQTGTEMRKLPLPVEDFQMPALIPDDPWERPLYDWKSGNALAQWRGFSPEYRSAVTNIMVSQGLIPEPLMADLDPRDPYGIVQLPLWEQALGFSNDFQTDPVFALYKIGDWAAGQRALEEADKASSGRLPFSPPAEVRTVPDYPTLQQRVTDMLEAQLGRSPEPWEVDLLADELKAQHEASNRAGIQAYRDAYNGANVGEFIEVPNPEVRTQRKLEETYANEISRLEDIGEAQVSNRTMIQAITRGAGMVGGR